MRCNYACPLTAGPESVHIPIDGADHVPLISSVYPCQITFVNVLYKFKENEQY